MGKPIKAGAKVFPDPLWNRTERPENRLSVPTVVLGVKSAACQSGLMYQVQTLGGSKCWLDAGWFSK